MVQASNSTERTKFSVYRWGNITDTLEIEKTLTGSSVASTRPTFEIKTGEYDDYYIITNAVASSTAAGINSGKFWIEKV